MTIIETVVLEKPSVVLNQSKPTSSDSVEFSIGSDASNRLILCSRNYRWINLVCWIRKFSYEMTTNSKIIHPRKGVLNKVYTLPQRRDLMICSKFFYHLLLGEIEVNKFRLFSLKRSRDNCLIRSKLSA